MARSDVVITIDVKDLEAFRIAYAALCEIANGEPGTDDPDTRERSYGTMSEWAQDALQRIEQVGPVPSHPKPLPPDQIRAPQGIGINECDGGAR